MRNRRNNGRGNYTRRAEHRTRRVLRLRHPMRLVACVLALVGVVLAAVAVAMLLGGEPRRAAVEDVPPSSFVEVVTPSPTAPDTTPKATPEASSAPDITPAAPAPRTRILPETHGGYPVVAMLTIDKLGIDLPVLGESSDAALEVSVCLYAGPDSPEFEGNIVVAGHNYKNDSHFGRLDELENGDIVDYTDKWGETYRYEVYDRETIKPDQIVALEEYEGDRALALLTCTQNGKSRLLVRCRLLVTPDLGNP